MKRWPWRILRVALAAAALLFATIAAEVAIGWRCQVQGQISQPIPQPQARKIITSKIPGYARPEDDTYLSYPEWYIVWSYQEKADFQQKHLPSGFPYFHAVSQYWGSYFCISRLIRGKYPMNFGEQIMLVVIGTSFSAEYILKGAYEETVGRLSEWTSSGHAVDEDIYAYKVAREYADFVHMRPFYEFRFVHNVKGLWTQTPLFGPQWTRKWERKAFLTTDYTVEGFYCWIIEQATHATYGHEPADTHAWIANANAGMFQQATEVKELKDLGGGSFIVDIPRYQEFTSVASNLTNRGAQFVDIAGNSQIIVSALAPSQWHYQGSSGSQVFSSSILTRPGSERVVINCNVELLGRLIGELRAGGATVEHVYDY